MATGTGDLAVELERRVGPRAGWSGMDFSEAMLEIARAQGARRSRFEAGNALELAYADDSFDAATVGFGARNFSDLRRGLAEMARVVRPGRAGGGARDHHAPAAAAVVVLPPVVRPGGAGASAGWPGDPDAYTYLPSSVRRFPGPARARGASWRRRA